MHEQDINNRKDYIVWLVIVALTIAAIIAYPYFNKWQNNHAIFEAVEHNNVQKTKSLLQKDATLAKAKQEQCHQSLVFYAKSKDMLELLMAYGVDPNNKETTNGNISILAIMASYGDIDSVKFLISKGADIDSKDDLGSTPLFCAAESGSIEVVKFLILQGADINIIDKEGNTALRMAIKRNHKDIANLLRKHGAKE